jgi:hypothetical protein
VQAGTHGKNHGERVRTQKRRSMKFLILETSSAKDAMQNFPLLGISDFPILESLWKRVPYTGNKFLYLESSATTRPFRLLPS